MCERGGRQAVESWMSDRKEHLSQKHTSRRLIHYSLNGGVIQTRGVCIHTAACLFCVRVCLCCMCGFHESCLSEI